MDLKKIKFEGKEYDLYKVLRSIEYKPTKTYPVIALKYILNAKDFETDAELAKIDKADLKEPILVTMKHGDLILVHGIYRLAKAVRENKKYILGKYVSKEALKTSRADIGQPIREVYTIGDPEEMDDPKFKHQPKGRPIWLTYNEALPFSKKITRGPIRIDGAVYLVLLPRGLDKDTKPSAHSWFTLTQPARVLRKIIKIKR